MPPLPQPTPAPMKTGHWIWIVVIVVALLLGLYLLVSNNPSGSSYFGETATSSETGVSATTTSPSSTTSGATGGVSAPSSAGYRLYTNSTNHFSFKYPYAFFLGSPASNTLSWMYNATSTGNLLAIVIVPTSYEPHTNLGESRFTVGMSTDKVAVAQCLSYNPTRPEVPTKVVINGVTYEKFESHDVGTGNYYDTTSYHTLRNGACYAIEYTIHYVALANFDPSLGVKAYDRAKIQAAFAAMVASFKFLQ